MNASAPGSRLKAKRKLAEKLVEGLLFLLTLLACTMVVLIFAFVFREAAPLLKEERGEELGGLSELFVPKKWPGHESRFVWQPVATPPKVNILPLIFGSLKIALIALLFATPTALGAAIFVSRFLKQSLRKWVRLLIELWAAIPTVVLGVFALMVLAPFLQSLFGYHYRLNAMVAGLALGIALIPTLFALSEEALHEVPRELVEAALALGATTEQVIRRVVLPHALPGISAAMVLALGRALGETMIVLMSSGNAPVIDFRPTTSARTMTAAIAAELGEVVPQSLHWQILFFIGTLLFGISFALQRLSVWMLRRLRVEP
ncbi:MAG: phosphate ABC transporter permease subunit PstC [Sandaracinaceae bacterium]|nr:phosphate ABC transporter permease subunit PstC [Sandaracinaceae bacterium]MDW8246690.1 phosphate ABC transporter permease subunit PstC [Sandaracinaceae bacterium]